MKSSSVLASVLFSTMALAAPLDKRAYATKTEVHVEYYTVYTTVTGAQPPAAATSDPALFYEEKPTTLAQQQPTAVTTSSSTSSSTVVAPEPTTTTTAPAVVEPTTTEKKPEPSTTSVAPPPAPTTTEAPPPPKPTTTQAPPPSTTSVVAEPEPTQPSSGGDGQVYTGGSYTMNYYGGGLGACGDPIDDGAMAVALAVDVFGDATVDYMTGKTNNPWCGKKIEISNGGKTAIAYVKDRCSGCTEGGLDATPALWEATTGGLGGASGDRIYSMSWKVVS